jgi:hypothetical protein
VKDTVKMEIKPSDLRALLNTFNKMGKAANKDLRDASYSIARDVASELKASASGANSIGGNAFQAQAVARGIAPRKDRLALIRVSGKRQVASGGASVEDLLWGAEFGSNHFIFPTLKRLQPKIRKDWVNAVGKVADLWRAANRG